MSIVKAKGQTDLSCRSLYCLIDRLIFKSEDDQAKKEVSVVLWLLFGVWIQARLLIGKRKYKKLLNQSLLKVDWSQWVNHGDFLTISIIIHIFLFKVISLPKLLKRIEIELFL